MAIEPPLFMQALTGDTPISYTAAQFRGLVDALAVPGVTHANDLKVSQQASGVPMSVDVAAGSCVIAGGSISYQGSYWCRSTSKVNVLINANASGSTRVDRIIAQLSDSQADGNGTYQWTPAVITGIPGSGIPNIDPLYYPSVITLGSVTVASGAASIVTANITDLRWLNLLGSRPQWQLKGGNGQAVPSGTNTTYSGWTYSNLIGVGTNTEPGAIVIRQPGQYSVFYSAKMDVGGTATAVRRAVVDHLDVNGVFIERIGEQEAYPGAGLTAAPGPGQTAAGTAICAAGDILRGRSYQASGATLHLYDADSQLRFTGSYFGPVT